MRSTSREPLFFRRCSSYWLRLKRQEEATKGLQAQLKAALCVVSKALDR